MWQIAVPVGAGGQNLEQQPQPRVHYRINEPVYEKLIRIVSTTRNIDRLIEFFSFHVFKLGKSIDELTDEEIARLVL